MRFVLDTNEFVSALGLVKHPASELLLAKLIDTFPANTIHIPRTIVNEVRRNLHPLLFTQFIKITQPIAAIKEDVIVPFEIGSKYESMGLKSADAFIAAFCEYLNLDALITENRHFLSRKSGLPFKVLNAESCILLISSK